MRRTKYEGRNQLDFEFELQVSAVDVEMKLALSEVKNPRKR